MNSNVLLLVLSLFIWSCVAPETASHLEGKYERVRELGDFYTAIVYLHELQDLGGETHSVYRRLAKCYFEVQNYAPAIKAADKILEDANELEKKDLLLIKAKSYTELAQYTDAIGVYDALALIDKDLELEYLYQTGVLYNAYGDLGSASLRMQEIIKNPLARLVQKNLAFDNAPPEQVTYYQAALNFIGVVQMQAKDLEQARLTYEQLLKEPKPFRLAMENYNTLLKIIETEKVRTE